MHLYFRCSGQLFIGFIFTGAKKGSDGVVYMVEWENKKENFIASSSREAKKMLVPLIDYLQSKIVFETSTGNQTRSIAVQSCGGVICKCKFII